MFAVKLSDLAGPRLVAAVTTAVDIQADDLGTLDESIALPGKRRAPRFPR